MILERQHFIPLPFVLFLLLLTGCGQSGGSDIDASYIHIPGAQPDPTAPAAIWASDSVDLGILAAGEIAQAHYTLTNSGRAPLVIAQVLPSCGCTVAKNWDEGPIQPGKTRTVTLEFDAGDRIGEVAEYATVVTNAVPSSTTLQFTARVMGPGSSTSTP